MCQLLCTGAKPLGAMLATASVCSLQCKFSMLLVVVCQF
jgi:hypothetical protein